MILIGQYDSPFVRRVGIVATLHGLPFEHRPWSVFGDAGRIRPYNALVRVPTLVLDDGTVVTDNHVIVAVLDGLATGGADLWPTEGPARRRAMATAALAMGMADKAVSLFYEIRLHEKVSPVWSERCRDQIAVACAWRFVGEAHPGLLAAERFPALSDFAGSAEQLPVFQAVSQPFIPPA